MANISLPVMIPLSEAPPSADAATLAALVGCHPGPALWLDGAGGLVSAGPSAQQLFEHGDAWWRSLSSWLAELPSGGAPTRTMPIETDGGTVVIEWAALPLAGATLLLGRDVTLERNLRSVLAESRQRFKDLVEISSDFAWETGPDGRFAFVSPEGALGFDAEALIGRTPEELNLGDAAELAGLFSPHQVLTQGEFWLRRSDGQFACVVAAATPLFAPDGSWQGARGLCRDVTELRQREAELARARLRDRLLNHIVQAIRDELDPAESFASAAQAVARAMVARGCRIYRADAEGRLSEVARHGDCPDAAALGPQLVGREAPLAEDWGDGHLLACRTEYRHAVNGVVVLWRPAEDPAFAPDEAGLLGDVALQLGIAHAHAEYQETLRRLSERDGLTGLY
ncbi:MAG TPA: PAS domain S-box protein, partial [Alphaproteobacteria bacterium]|nr:PAS domain S-box protein [Alphaproteobacteria bacterium]